MERYAQYMGKNRVQADGSVRDSDNWQKGIPLAAYMKSLWRHFHDAWLAHRSGRHGTSWMEECLCAIIFNAMGYLHEILKDRRDIDVGPDIAKEVTAVHDELAKSRKWDEGCSGGMGPMAPSMARPGDFASSKLGQREPPTQAEDVDQATLDSSRSVSFPKSWIEPNQQEKL